MYEVERSGDTERITIRGSGGVVGTSAPMLIELGFTSRFISRPIVNKADQAKEGGRRTT